MNRALDVTIAAAGLALSSPFLAAGALAVKLADRGPVLYRQTRVGKDGADFDLLKLRTMVVGAETAGRGLRRRQGRRAHHRAGPPAPPALDRRAAAALERRARRDVDHRPAPDAPLPGRRLRRASSCIGSTSSPGSPAGRRSTAAPRCPGPSGSSSTSGTSRHHDWKTDLLILLRTPLALFGGTYKGTRRRLEPARLTATLPGRDGRPVHVRGPARRHRHRVRARRRDDDRDRRQPARARALPRRSPRARAPGRRPRLRRRASRSRRSRTTCG